MARDDAFESSNNADILMMLCLSINRDSGGETMNFS